MSDTDLAVINERHRQARIRDLAATRIVEACPHEIKSWDRVDRFVRVFQHGDNPEARLEVPAMASVEGDNISFAPIVAEWVERIHAYERTGRAVPRRG